MPDALFTDEYARVLRDVRTIPTAGAGWTNPPARPAISSQDRNMRRLQAHALDLPFALNAAGFSPLANGVLRRFREGVISAAAGGSEGAVLMDLFGARVGPPGLTDAALKRVMACKMLRHTYRMHRQGAQTFWFISLPQSFSAFTYAHLQPLTANAARFEAALDDTTEQFDRKDRRFLSEAVDRAAGWCDSARQVAQRAVAGHQADRDMVRRWFAQPGTPDATIIRLARKLDAGFTRIAQRIRANVLIFLDNPAKRAGMGTTYAYVAPRETMSLVFMGRHFYDRTFKRFPPPIFWALTVVHELSHLVEDTDDFHYDHGQIGVRTSHTIAHAAWNADNWAYFAADAAGQIRADQRDWALIGRAMPHMTMPNVASVAV